MAKIGIGIIGAGSIADIGHCPSIRELENAELIALCDNNKENLDKLQKKWEPKRVYTDYHDLIRDKEIQVVIVATPNYLHHEQTITALKEKKHVRTDIIYGRLSRKWQAILDIIFFGVIFLPFVGVLLWKTTENAIFAWQINERTFSMWGPPIAPSKTVFALSFLLLALQGIAKLLRDIVYVVKGEEI